MLGSSFRLEPCFKRWVLLLVSAVTALGLLERFLTRLQALCNPSFVDRAIAAAATPLFASTESQLVTRAKLSLQRVGCLCPVPPAASAGSRGRFARAPRGLQDLGPPLEATSGVPVAADPKTLASSAD